jgi:hypothetical protein
MNNANLTIARKTIANGKKTINAVMLDGVVLDTRESTKGELVAVVAVKTSYTESAIMEIAAKDIANLNTMIGRLEKSIAAGTSCKMSWRGQKDRTCYNHGEMARTLGIYRTGLETRKTMTTSEVVAMYAYRNDVTVLGWSRDAATGAALGRSAEALGYKVVSVG